MSERHLYGSDNQFAGSIDDDGRIYDSTHVLKGYVRDGTIYDICNIPLGRITDNGMVIDNAWQEVGIESGTAFFSSGTRETLGSERAGILSEGRGRDYGAYHLLDRNNRNKYDPYPYDDDSDDGDDGYDYGDDDSEADEDYGCYDDDSGMFEPQPTPSHRHHTSHGGNGGMPISNEAGGCIGCGCFVFFIIGLFLLLRIYSGVPFSEW